MWNLKTKKQKQKKNPNFIETENSGCQGLGELGEKKGMKLVKDHKFSIIRRISSEDLITA